MIRSIVGVVFFSFLAAVAGAATPAKPAPSDADLAKGIKLVEDGEYDEAIWILDTASQRLAKDPAKAADLAQAYLYLGIAYVGKGHDAAAKAKFRAALLGSKDLTLSATKFPPKVINLFEAARDEASAAPKAGGGGGGSKKWLLIGGGAVAAGGAAVVLAGGGGSDGETFTGTLCGEQYSSSPGGCDYYRDFDIVVGADGTLEATVTWTEPTALYQILLRDQNYADIAASNRTSNTSSRLTAAVSPQTACSTCAYHLLVARSDRAGTPGPFTLTVRHP